MLHPRLPLTMEIEDAIAMRPTLSSELPCRHGEAAGYVHKLNLRYRQIGSHWRIKGKRQWIDGRITNVMYRFVMVNL